MRLQILVNHFNESERTVSGFLGSLARQEAVSWDDMEVLVRSDGRDHALSDEFLGSFGIPIRYEAAEHSGVCHTRNALMDMSDADYLMFCDIDDCMHSTLGLYHVMKAMDDVGTDIIAAPYLTERDGNYVTERRDTIHVFSKAFKRSYLVENGIRFPDEMPTSGDMFFLWLAFNLDPTVAWTEFSFYVWKDNPNSVTRARRWHMAESYDLLMRNYELLHEELVRRGRDDLVGHMIGATFAMMYVHSHDRAHTDAPEEALSVMREAVSRFVGRHREEYESLPNEVKRVSLEAHKRAAGTGFGDLEGMDGWVSSVS